LKSSANHCQQLNALESAKSNYSVTNEPAPSALFGVGLSLKAEAVKVIDFHNPELRMTL